MTDNFDMPLNKNTKSDTLDTNSSRDKKNFSTPMRNHLATIDHGPSIAYDNNSSIFSMQNTITADSNS